MIEKNQPIPSVEVNSITPDTYPTNEKDNPLVGEGSFTRVYETPYHDKGEAKTAVVKVFRYKEENLLPEQLYREIDTVRGLGEHPYLPKLIDAVYSKETTSPVTQGESSPETKQIALMYEKVSGAAPLEFLKKLEPAERFQAVIKILEQLAELSLHAEKNNFWLTDLKPGNILIEGDILDTLVVKLVDFGAFTSQKSENELPVTLNFFPPELRGIKAHQVTPEQVNRINVYMFGSMAYELLGHELPEVGGYNDRARLLQDMELDDKFIQYKDKKILLPDTMMPPEVYQVLKKAFTNEEVYPTVTDLIAALKKHETTIVPNPEPITEEVFSSLAKEIFTAISRVKKQEQIVTSPVESLGVSLELQPETPYGPQLLAHLEKNHIPIATTEGKKALAMGLLFMIAVPQGDQLYGFIPLVINDGLKVVTIRTSKAAVPNVRAANHELLTKIAESIPEEILPSFDNNTQPEIGITKDEILYGFEGAAENPEEQVLGKASHFNNFEMVQTLIFDLFSSHHTQGLQLPQLQEWLRSNEESITNSGTVDQRPTVTSQVRSDFADFF